MLGPLRFRVTDVATMAARSVLVASVVVGLMFGLLCSGGSGGLHSSPAHHGAAAESVAASTAPGSGTCVGVEVVSPRVGRESGSERIVAHHGGAPVGVVSAEHGSSPRESVRAKFVRSRIGEARGNTEVMAC